MGLLGDILVALLCGGKSGKGRAAGGGTKIGWKNARNAASITVTANATTAAMKTARIGDE